MFPSLKSSLSFLLILNAYAFRIIHLELLLFLKELYVVRYSLFYQVVLCCTLDVISYIL